MLSYTTGSPRATVQQVLLRYYEPEANTNGHVHKVLRHLMQCRTAALGYHLYKCADQACGHVKYQYHSCRDRHCPNCGGLKKQEWIEAGCRSCCRSGTIMWSLPCLTSSTAWCWGTESYSVQTIVRRLFPNPAQLCQRPAVPGCPSGYH
jgi:Transposase zinc-binding domain